MSGFEADQRGAKKRDYWFTVLLTDPVAVPLTTFLAKRRLMTPNQVTIVSLLLGLSVGVFFATGERWGLIAGGIAFYLAFVTDCVDGKLARATGITSDKGEALDALADGGRRASASFGLAAYVYADLAGTRQWPGALAAAVAVGITLVYGLIVERVLRPLRGHLPLAQHLGPAEHCGQRRAQDRQQARGVHVARRAARPRDQRAEGPDARARRRPARR